jgi:hypothetical protein
MRGTLLLVSGVLGVASFAATQQSEPPGRPAQVASADPKLVVRRAIFLDGARFSNQGQQGVGPLVHVENGSQLLMVDVESDFPVGKSWNLAGFIVRTAAAATDRRHVVGFTVPHQQGALRFYPQETGAAAFLLKGKVEILENAPNKRFEITFDMSVFGMTDDSTRWPGGRANVRLLFHVPKTWTRIELARIPV